jgi:hypothetical protein
MKMLSLTKKEDETDDDTDSFRFTSKFINDELELIQTQQENIISISSQLENALSHEENIKKFLNLMKEIDKTINAGLTEKRKKEIGMIRLIDDVKHLLSEQKYEDIDRLMRSAHRRSQEKIHLSQAQLNKLREFMTRISLLYQEAAGFCRLSQLIYARLSNIYDNCQQELETELSEEESLSKAGAYTGSGEGKVVRSMSFKNLLSDGASKWFTRY